MKWLIQLIVVSVLMATLTWFAGWWMVPVIGAAYGAWAARQRLTLVTATLSAVLGWGALLAYDASAGPLGRLLQVLGALFRLPGAALIVLTLAYAALLAVSAAALARSLRRLVMP
ncbi:MAG TPA: hypothetical protein VIK25_03890 [Gemmatimonadaceae bacterium]